MIYFHIHKTKGDIIYGMGMLWGFPHKWGIKLKCTGPHGSCSHVHVWHKSCFYTSLHVLLSISFVSELLPKCLTPQMLVFTDDLRILIWKLMLIKSWVQIPPLSFVNLVTLAILTFSILSILIYKAPSMVWKKIK